MKLDIKKSNMKKYFTQKAWRVAVEIFLIFLYHGRRILRYDRLFCFWTVVWYVYVRRNIYPHEIALFARYGQEY